MGVTKIPEETAKKIQPYTKLYSASKAPAAFFDGSWRCIWTNDPAVFDIGEYLLSYLADGVPHPIRDYTEAKLLKGGQYYCVRIIPLKTSVYDPWLYICEMFDRTHVVSMLESTDAVTDFLQMFNAVHTSTSIMWKNFIKLKPMLVDKGYFDIAGEISSAEKGLCDICSVTQNVYEYLNSLCCDMPRIYIDGSVLCRMLVKRCNELLTECGRKIELDMPLEDLRFLGHGRLATAALVNAIQNALLYSPEDTTPVMEVRRVSEGGAMWVRIKLTNDNILFTGTDFKGNDNINFRYQRLGYGIPIIKRFAAMSGGKFTIEEKDGKVEATLMLPIPTDNYSSTLRLETPDYVEYRTGIPTLVEIKMREVVDFFLGDDT